MVMAGMFDSAINAAKIVAADAAARSAAIMASKAANAVRATNPNASAATSSGIGGIPTPVLIGGVAAVGLVAVLMLAKKKKR